MGSCAAPSAKGDDKFITTDYLQQCRLLSMSNSCDVISPCSCCYTNLSNSSATPLPTTCDGQVVCWA
ncbi:hypothetical protein, partial [Escherichia coli]|uniref:hypothetical protein n=1 Tax=Escherichia coli TaxID=562 RepID=UPI0019553C64